MKRASSILVCCGAGLVCWALTGLLGPGELGQARGEGLTAEPSAFQIAPAVTPPGDRLTGEPTGTPLDVVIFTPGPEASPEPTPEPRQPWEAGVVAGPDYDFSQPVPETEPVEDEYFADAVFIGDSRTDGFRIFSGLTQGDYLVKTGLSVFKVEDEKIKVDDGKLTVAEALERKEYGKVYVCLGLNELGMNNDQGYYDHYAHLIDLIRAVRPKAAVYIQLLIPVNEQKRTEKGGADYVNNAQIQVYNDLLYQLAREKHVFLVDPAQVIVDETGQPAYDEVADGIHFQKAPYQRWLDYLRRHTADKGEWE